MVKKRFRILRILGVMLIAAVCNGRFFAETPTAASQPHDIKKVVAADVAALNAIFQRGLPAQVFLKEAAPKHINVWETAAKSGNPQGACLLGLAYEHNFAPPPKTRDFAKAAELYQQAAKKNCALGMRLWGKCLLEGNGVKKNKTQGREWLTKAADQGDTLAMIELGNSYAYSDGLDFKECVTKVQWYHKAMESGDTNGIVSMAYTLQNGGNEKQQKKAAALFQDARKKGNINAVVALALCYSKGKGVEKDEKKAVELLQEAIAAGSPFAMWRLAICYEDGEGVPEDPAKAIEWRLKAAQNGSTNAMVSMGYHYMSKRGKKPDYPQAIKWFTRAADAGSVWAMLELGMGQLKNRGLPHNEKEGLYWLKQAANRESTRASFELGKYYFLKRNDPKNIHIAIDWFNRGAALDDPFSMYYLGRMYYFGLGGTPVDKNKGLEWYAKAAKNGHPDAQEFVANYYRCKAKETSDEKEKQKLYKKARHYENSELVEFLKNNQRQNSSP